MIIYLLVYFALKWQRSTLTFGFSFIKLIFGHETHLIDCVLSAIWLILDLIIRLFLWLHIGRFVLFINHGTMEARSSAGRLQMPARDLGAAFNNAGSLRIKVPSVIAFHRSRLFISTSNFHLSMVPLNYFRKLRLKWCFSISMCGHVWSDCPQFALLFWAVNEPNQPNYSQTWLWSIMTMIEYISVLSYQL